MADELEGQVPETAAEDAGSTEQEQAPDAVALLREIEKLRKENAKWRTSLRKLEAQQEEAERSEMSELERLKADLAKAEEARAKAEAVRVQTLVRSQVVAAAARLNYADPEDAYRLLDADALEVDDAGNINGLDAALEELAKGKPYLLKRTSSQFSPTNPAAGAGRPSDDAILAEIYGSRKTQVWGGPGGGVFWSTKPE